MADTRQLFLDYASSLDFDLGYQGFDREMENFPGDYDRPDGALVLTRVDGVAAGAVGLRRMNDDPDLGRICEMKRLYVRDGFRGLSLGRSLVEGVLREGRSMGYSAMRLDTVSTMTEAIGLYQSLGFSAIGSYNDSPLDNARYYQLLLT